ncbi:GNAT family N-acetyltransferase [Aliivibrio sifiae]|uniref:Acetyltransferase n=1 Tax=Aliivibrio sifiae TaxID=566293 RepID=A0A2S7X859_9GAMM|nr:GNAT family N-acetyltransferase [Aliivibrio sifiae]PQJ87457.1 GNAT family N-acetyltransferase [Aliivibrio sifiae]GLR77170.1 acetyltransferase [Aliivibrio sifiae]
MDIQFKRASELKYAESLTQSNMASYYLARNIVWDSSLFIKNWALLDNFEIFADNHRVGIVRFSYNESTTFLRVFSENPAIKLYKEKGFTQTVEVNGLIEMEFTLSSNT